ncbi:hypothetical protein [Pseudomonas sp.]|uniref:hypothetical protein n=1 Tax=Pseudomonas sp. TaxID=306 RepID=UPI003266C778
MSVSIVDRAALLESKRDFLCWRGREFDERYEWRVLAIDPDTVRIEIESEGLDFTLMVAEEIAFCLSEALAIAEQDGEFSATAAVREEGSLNRKYRLSRGAWKFSATGVVDVKNVSSGLRYGKEGSGLPIGVRTIEEGGFEIELGGDGYSFSVEDAYWLQEKLLEVSRQSPMQHYRVNLLEAMNGGRGA